MDRQNILLIILDAVRSDHVSCYGYSRNTTPAIEKIADEGLVYENAFSNSNWTGTSHAALFTGHLPSVSRVHGGHQELPKDVTTLPEHLQSAGYRTFGISAGAHVRGERGYNRGFDTFKETYRISLNKTFFRRLLTDGALRKQTGFTLTRGPDKKSLYKFESLKRWISSGDTPFFGFINGKTAHHPYNPPRSYKSEFCPELERPPIQLIEEILAGDAEEAQRVPGFDMERIRKLSYQYPVIAEEFTPTAEEWELIESWYDGSIRYMDSLVEDLFEFLERQNLLENTYVFITADHGEYFGEHGLEKHYYELYEPVLHIPLVVHSPDGESIRVTDPVSLADLFPTILNIAGLSVDRPHTRTIFPDERDEGSEYIFAELGNVSPIGITRHHPEFDDTDFGIPTQVVRDDEYKLIARADGSRELYRWRSDPAEYTDLSEGEPAAVEELEAVIEGELPPLSNEPLDENIENEDLKHHLQDLGYM